MSVYADLLLQYALAAHKAGHSAQAETVARMAIGAADTNAHALYLLGHMLCARGRLDDATWFLTKALAVDPDHSRAHNALGETLRARGRHQDALAHFEHAVRLAPDPAFAYANLAAALVALNRPEEAVRWAQESLRRSDEKPAAHCALGEIFGRLNRSGEAIHQYDLALAARPGNPRARYCRSLMLLTLGRLQEAWPEHEARLELPPRGFTVRGFHEPRWTGEQELAGRTILLHAEQGCGDTIQFVRYAPLVAARGATVILEVQRGLGRLCATVQGVAQVVEAAVPKTRFDLQCSLMSLPAAFGTCLQGIPAAVPYLGPDPAVLADWSRALGPWRRMRVGLAWSDGPHNAPDPERSVPLELLASLLKRSDITCHAIQRDIGDADRRALVDFPGLADHSAALTDFVQAAALIASMDLIISVDAPAAHLAGAMNVPAWIMLPHAADWRWLRDRDDSPWYPSLRLFRQKRRGDWSPVIEQIGANLDQWAIRRG